MTRWEAERTVLADNVSTAEQALLAREAPARKAVEEARARLQKFRNKEQSLLSGKRGKMGQLFDKAVHWLTHEVEGHTHPARQMEVAEEALRAWEAGPEKARLSADRERTVAALDAATEQHREALRQHDGRLDLVAAAEASLAMAEKAERAALAELQAALAEQKAAREAICSAAPFGRLRGGGAGGATSWTRSRDAHARRQSRGNSGPGARRRPYRAGNARLRCAPPSGDVGAPVEPR